MTNSETGREGMLGGIYTPQVPGRHAGCITLSGTREAYPGVCNTLRYLEAYPGVYTQHPRYLGGIPWCIYLPTMVPGRHTLVYIPTLPWYREAYPGVYTLLYTPGYTAGIHCPAHYWVHCSTAAGVLRERSLGSKREKGLGGSLSGP